MLGPALAAPVIRVLGAPIVRLRGLAGNVGRENAMRNPRRTAATASALMVGVALVAAISVLASSAKASVAKSIDGTFGGDLVVEGSVMSGGGFSPQLAATIAALPEIETVTGIRATTVEIGGHTHQLGAVDVSAIGDLFDLGPTIGTFDDLDATHIAVAAGQGVAVGDVLDVQFAETGLQRLTVAAVYANDEAAGTHLVDLSAFEGNVGEQLDSKVFATVDPGSSVAEAKRAVREVAAAYPGAHVRDRAEFVASAGRHVDAMLNLVLALLLLAIVIALVGVTNTLALSILERTRELGLFRAVGMSRRQLRTTVRWEAVLVAMLGASSGLAVGTGFGWAITKALADDGLTAVTIPIGQLLVIAGLAAVAGVLAAILPARRAARLDVLHAVTTA